MIFKIGIVVFKQKCYTRLIFALKVNADPFTVQCKARAVNRKGVFTNAIDIFTKLYLECSNIRIYKILQNTYISPNRFS